ncbi:hypothetical protein ASZ90_002564 [hydrocarbon metagenome]|uniref:TsaA-like domain-containing protein n=1 Tax=hydrocarbon metagenome TaxID=938273 RepID=A0A0W8G340_9ZZZZ
MLQVLSVAGNLVELENVDMLDQTPVLNIKPYVADFDVWDADRFGPQSHDHGTRPPGQGPGRDGGGLICPGLQSWMQLALFTGAGFISPANIQQFLTQGES